MHTFQPYPIDLMEMNPFTKIGKEWMLITAGDEKKANTMTASWGGVGVLWGKNVVYIFVRDTRYTKEFIDNGETFSLTFLDESNKGALKYLGAVSGRDENKIENARMHLDYCKDTTGIRDLEQAAEHLAAHALYMIEVEHATSVSYTADMVNELF